MRWWYRRLGQVYIHSEIKYETCCETKFLSSVTSSSSRERNMNAMGKESIWLVSQRWRWFLCFYDPLLSSFIVWEKFCFLKTQYYYTDEWMHWITVHLCGNFNSSSMVTISWLYFDSVSSLELVFHSFIIAHLLFRNSYITALCFDKT